MKNLHIYLLSFAFGLLAFASANAQSVMASVAQKADSETVQITGSNTENPTNEGEKNDNNVKRSKKKKNADAKKKETETDEDLARILFITP